MLVASSLREVGQDLALDRVSRHEIQLKFSQLRSPLRDIVSRMGVVKHGP
jgi:hypothetical protein